LKATSGTDADRPTRAPAGRGSVAARFASHLASLAPPPFLPLLFALALAATSCGPAQPAGDRVLLVTTHSVEDSGLLEVLTTAFHDAHPELRLVTTAVGSGAALEMGRRGDADLLLTHDPAGEARFMAEGHGTELGPIMENCFVLVGPAADPAGVAGTTEAIAAFQTVARSGSRFLSRGDDSGTHQKERDLWRAAGLEPWSTRPAWYVEAGLGMGETLQTGAELDAYLLTDRATFRHLGHVLHLVPLVEDDPLFYNPYSYVIPRRQRNPEGARAVADWLTGPGQAVIADYGVEAYGEPLFRPPGYLARITAPPAPGGT
jgi:tungstate transport system substrate-binding protein